MSNTIKSAKKYGFYIKLGYVFAFITLLGILATLFIKPFWGLESGDYDACIAWVALINVFTLVYVSCLGLRRGIKKWDIAGYVIAVLVLSFGDMFLPIKLVSYFFSDWFNHIDLALYWNSIPFLIAFWFILTSFAHVSMLNRIAASNK